MGTLRLSWLVAVWALLASAAALEEYDEVPRDVDNVTYQDDNSLDTGPAALGQKGPDLALKDRLLYKLLKRLQNEDKNSGPKYRANWTTGLQKLNHLDTNNDNMSEKDAVVKRITDSLRGSKMNIGFKGLDQMYRPQQKWKIKKGKTLGSQMVCYFKLCAFRSPM